jgi:tetratricopeptide (TPR) repeat protein/O-antigen ligase
VESARLVPDRVVLGAAVVLTCVMFLSDASDPVNVVKLAALLVCAVVLAGLAVARVVRDRVLHLPTGAPAVVGVALLGALLLATVVAPHTPTAVEGTLGRNSGLLAYGAAVLLYLVALRVLDVGTSRAVLFGVLLAGAFTGLYGLLQYRGVDAIAWSNPFNPVIAALGNPDFASGYLGIAAPAAAWGALWTGWHAVLRVLSGLTLLLLLGVAAVSSAVQGPLAAAAGLTVLLVAWLLGAGDRVRRPGLVALAVAAVLALLVLVAGVLGAGPASGFFSGISYRARTWYWEAALTMFGSSPIWGVGLDSYGTRWRVDRPVQVPRELGGDHFSDAAHSVPLQMLAQGGLVLGLAYLALVVLVAVCLVRGLRRLDGQDRLQLGALGGCWAAYQLQSVVSIDQVPLLVVHFVLSGAVVAASGAVRLREVRLPGALPVAAPPTGRRRGPSLAPRRRALTVGDQVALGAVVLVGLFLAWTAITPVRASRAAYAGGAAAAQGDGPAAVADYERAIDLAPHVSAYRTSLGLIYNQSGRPDDALATYRGAAAADPFDIGAVRTTGRLEQAAGQDDEAARWFERAVRLDPTNPDTVLDLAKFRLQHSGAQEALTLLTKGVADVPGNADLWAWLGDARLVTGDRTGAKQAYDRALAIAPGQEVATAGLEKLAARA